MTAEMVDYYKQRSGEYDHAYETSRIRTDIMLIRGLVAGYFKGSNVFETACGTGYWTRILAEHATRVYAADINEDTLAIAKSREYPRKNVTLTAGDAYAAADTDLRFNAGLAGFWMSHVDYRKMETFLQAFHARLQSGARVMIFDEKHTALRDQYCPTSRRDEANNRYEIRHLENGDEYEIIKNFYQPEQFAEIFRNYGHNFIFEELQHCWLCTYRVN